MGLFAKVIDEVLANLTANEKALSVAVNTANYNTLRTEQQALLGVSEDVRPIQGSITVTINANLPDTGAGSIEITKTNVNTETIDGSIPV